MSAEFRIYLNNQAADEDQLDLFGEIRVDQAIGLVTEAELHLDINVDEDGYWSGIEEDYVQPFQRVRIEVKVADGDFEPIIDGPIVGQRFEMSAAPNESKLVMIVQDDSVLLNREETVQLFEEMTASDIASQIFQAQGFTTQVDSTDDAGATLERVIVQRGTSMQLLRELARRHGMFVYVLPGDSPGSSIGVFARPELSSSEFPEMVLLGKERNINKLDIEFDALRPVEAVVHTIAAADLTPSLTNTFLPDEDILGDTGTHDMVEPGTVMLSRTREEVNDNSAAANATVNFSSWAYSAKAEIDTAIYPHVLSPYKTVTIAGAGGYLSGDYMISHVTHILNNASYKQEIGLRRNARLNGSGGSAGITGGIF